LAEADPKTRWQRFRALPKDSPPKTLAFAFVVALSAALVVSLASVLLKPLQQANLERERQARIVAIVSAAIGDTGPLTAYVVDLASGRIDRGIDPVTYDQLAAAKKPESSIALPPEADIAGLGRRAKHATVFLRVEAGKVRLIVLPVRGMGYQSSLFGYLALKGDANTVAALSFYQQGDTPGLGARITEPAWQALWPGKRVADETGTIRISVVKGTASGPYEVDGITGATRTGNGVTHLIKFWLGDYGFGPFLDRVKSGQLEP
jgi:Na+-transporting NADH:ubiquinone oxidoreductase subunit C